MSSTWQSLAARIAALYAVAGMIWIAASDVGMGRVAGASFGQIGLNVIKGFCFVAATSLVLYLVLKRWLARESALRQKAETTSQELKELQTIATHSGEILYKHDAQNRFSYVSPHFFALLGFSPEVLGRPWTELLSKNPLNQRGIESTERAIRTGERQPPYLLELRKADGNLVLLEVDESPLKDVEGKVIAIVGAARDVTEREAVAEAVRESEEKFRRLAEAISEVFWMTSLDLKEVLYVSPAYERIWGRTCASLRREPGSWFEAIHPEDRAIVRPLISAGVEPKEASCEYRIIRPDGSIRWIFDRMYPVLDEAGCPVALAGIAKDITQRKQAEHALLENEEKLRGLYTSMNEGLALHEIIPDAAGRAVDYRILDVNPAFEDITGLRRDQVVGNRASAVYGRGEAPHLDVYAQVAASGAPTNLESFYEPLNKHLSVSVFSPRQGQFATVFADVSKRKEAERQICLLNQVYALISHVNEAIVRLSDRRSLLQETCRIVVEQGRFVIAWVGMLERGGIHLAAAAGCDEEMRQLIAAELDHMSGKRHPAIVALDEGRVAICRDLREEPGLQNLREPLLARGCRSVLALPLRHRGGVAGVLNVYAAEPDFFTALISESLIEVAADVSFALGAIEHNLERETEREQLRLQHTALEAAANAIVITNRSGTIQWVNEAFTRLTGYSREEAVGKNPRLLRSGVHDRAFYRNLWETILSRAVWQGTLQNKHKNGFLYEEEMTITPVRGTGGEVTHFIAIKQDISERRKLELQFLRAQRMQSIGLLAGGVAHDLNNVLTPVLMALPLLRDALPREQRDQILATLEQGVKRGANIVQQVLTFARGVEVQRTLVQPRHLLKEMAKIAEETFPRDIQVLSNVPAGLWNFEGDPTQIHQVLLNLAVNARDAMAKGGQLTFGASNLELREPRQFLGSEVPPGRYVTMSVTDTGTGIPGNLLEHIFEPFFTTKPVGKGTGLGLSTVLGIMRSHQGLVEVQTREGAGSVFTVYLPAAPEGAQTASGAAPAGLAQGRGEMILVVDDEESILHITRSILETNGYRVCTATNGREAIARLAAADTRVEAVITDLMMPTMDGLSLIRLLRQHYPQLPVIATTGLTQSQDSDRGTQLRALGAGDLLRKPCSAEELLERLDAVLGGNTEPAG